MAIKEEFDEIKDFEDWYAYSRIDPRSGARIANGLSACANAKVKQFDSYKTEMDARVSKYERYEKQAAAEFVSQKPDLPNVSSGESAGFIRRMSRNTVQHTPNVMIKNEFDEDGIQGTIAEYLLKTKIIGDDEYSNDMQQNLITTARRAFTIGFDCVIPSLQQDAQKKWYMLYDTIHYRDVFPEPGVKDIRRATDVFIRRYLTRGEVHALIKNQVYGWDIAALKALLATAPAPREVVDHENKKHKVNSSAYEIITWYSSTGQDFLTFSGSLKLLLRIEKNKHPLKQHPVFFFVPEKDENQPLGKSLLSLTYGRQEFQDLFMNGAMKLWWRNINPPIIGYGTVNAIPNLSPGKYTQINNPNAKVEAFEVNTQALMMFQNIASGNAGNMAQLMGATDQQMAAQGTGGMMSQTPQGVEAQQAMVDITTNNYQKAMEVFFSKYCSYALSIYFQELKGVKSITPDAAGRKALTNAGLPPEAFDEDGSIKIDFSELATLYYVQTIPGSLIEMEDEKQIRILNELFVPLSQAMPALAQTGNQEVLNNAAAAIQFIVRKQIELSGSQHSSELNLLLGGQPEAAQELTARMENLEAAFTGEDSEIAQTADLQNSLLLQLQEQVSLLSQSQAALARALGISDPAGAGDAGGQSDASAPQSQAPGATPTLA